MSALCVGVDETGRWTRAQRSPNLRGKSAASLSSGGIRTPRRWYVRKSRVAARETIGPPVEYAVYVIRYSSSQRVIRGSSIPKRSACRWRSGWRARSGSTTQPVRPSALRATQR